MRTSKSLLAAAVFTFALSAWGINDAKKDASASVAGIPGETNAAALLRLSHWAATATESELVEALVKARTDRLSTRNLYFVASAKFRDLYGENGESTLQRKLSEFTQAQWKAIHGEESTSSDPLQAFEETSRLQIHPNDQESQLLSSLRQLAETNPQKAIELAEQRPGFNRITARENIASAWALKDAPAAWKWVNQRPPSQETDGLKRLVLEAWAEQDITDAMKVGISVPVSEEWKRYFPKIAAQYFKANPEIALAWSKNEPVNSVPWLNQKLDNEKSLALALAAMEVLSTTHPEAAIEILNTLDQTEEQQGNHVKRLVDGWARKDADACIAWIRSLPEGRLRTRAIQEAGRSLAEENPKKAIELFQSTVTEAFQPEILEAIITRMANQHHPEEALQWALSLPPSPAAAHALGEAGGRMAQKDPKQALKILNALSPDAYADETAAIVTYGWFTTAPDEALHWVKSLKDARRLDIVVCHLADRSVDWDPTWVEHDLKDAMEFATGLPDCKARTELAHDVVQKLAKQDPVKAVEWVSALQPSEAKNNGTRDALGALAVYQPAAALEKLDALPTDGPVKKMAVQRVLSTMVNFEPVKAAQWLDGFSSRDSKMALSVVSPFLLSWRNKDSHAMVQWVAAIQNAGLKQKAIGDILPYLASSDSAAAVTVAEALPPGKSRVSAMQKALLPLWKKKQPDALAALANSSLSDEEKAAVKPLLK